MEGAERVLPDDLAAATATAKKEVRTQGGDQSEERQEDIDGNPILILLWRRHMIGYPCHVVVASRL
eukprot:2304394-Pyramimonas_sp.AAC.1